MTTAPSRIASSTPLPAILTFVLSLVVAATANAQTGVPSATSQQAPPLQPPACDDRPSDILPAGNLKLSVTVDRTTVWQPRGGEVKFTITGTGFSPENMAIIACFRWKADDTAKPVKSPAVRLIDNGTAGAATFSATVPELSEARWGWLDRVSGQAAGGASTGLAIVPLADFRVMARSMANPATAWSPLDVTLPVGITSPPFSATVAIVLVVIAWTVLYTFGRIRDVPGGSDPLLNIISTKGGYASLSQLQIILWSFVIGASAVYVMALSGNLIDITQGTLVLLGISGVATVGSKLQSHTETQSAPPSRPVAPGAVVGFGRNGPEGDTEVRLYWAAPTDGGRPDSYTVQYRAVAANPGPWLTATSTLTRPGFRVVGLTSKTSYEFQVFGVNAAGPGAAVLVTGTTQPPPAAGPGIVANFRPFDVTNTKIELIWDALANAASYKVQYRIHDSDDGWSAAGSTIDSAVIAGLQARTLYDLRIAAAASPATGATPSFGPWATTAVATTGPRIPLWSDLVVAGDGQNEIDVTRVQMLFFTVIVAIFVALRVLTSSEIPTIPEGFLLLMGISNGVYLTAKFIPS